MSLTRLDSLFFEYVQQLHACEAQVAKEMPRLVHGALSQELQTLLQEHSEESLRHKACLAKILKQYGVSAHGVRSRIADSLLKHALEVADMRGSTVLLDLSLILILRQLENFERGLYEIAIATADVLEQPELVKTLKSCSIDEEQMEQSLIVLGDDMMDSLKLEKGMHADQSEKGSWEGASAV
jgi:ferritin-like metal-binding protein YciE